MGSKLIPNLRMQDRRLAMIYKNMGRGQRDHIRFFYSQVIAHQLPPIVAMANHGEATPLEYSNLDDHISSFEKNTRDMILLSL